MKCAFIIKGSKNEAIKVQKASDNGNAAIIPAYWMKYRDKDAEYYQVNFGDIDLNVLKMICGAIPEVSIEQVEIEFSHNDDCIEKLIDVGFVRYEETDYVEFNDTKHGVRVSLMKSDWYKLIVSKSDDILISPAYLYRLIKRIFTIIGQ